MNSFFHFIKRYQVGEQAATAVEFALIAIPFLIMMFGIMEAGRLAWTINGVQYSIEEAGRYASLNQDVTTEELSVYAQDKMRSMKVSADPLQVTFSTLTSNGYDFVEIDGSYDYASMLGNFLPGDFGNFEYTTSIRKPVLY